MDKSVPRVTVWHHSAEPRDAKTVTLGTDLSIRSRVMPNSDPRDRFVHPYLILMSDFYIKQRSFV